MAKAASRWQQTLLAFTLLKFLVQGSLLSASRTVGGVFKRRLRTQKGFANLDLMASTYEIMRERLSASLKEIEEKTRVLEDAHTDLVDSRNFLQAIIDNLDIDLMVLDSNLRVVQANNRLAAKNGSGIVAGQFCYQISRDSQQPCDIAGCDCPLSEVKQTRRTVSLVQTWGTAGSERIRERFLDVSISPLFDGQGKITRFIELVRDVTASKEMESRILEANRHLLVLNTISNAASQSLSLDVVLNAALDKILELFEADTGGILLCDEQTGLSTYGVQRNLPEESVLRSTSLEMARQVNETGETITRRSPRVGTGQQTAFDTFVSAPLKSKDRVAGVITVVRRKDADFSALEIQLLASIGQQLGVVVENAELYRELQIKEEARTALLRRIILVQEDERQRVARELHDVTSQTLATLAVGLQGLVNAPRPTEPETDTRLEKMRTLLSETSKDIHRLIYDLRPSLLDDLGLWAAVQSCAHNSLDPAGVEIHMEVAGQERKLAPEIEIAVFRIAQEAIANIAKHARAEWVYINLEYRDKGIVFQIEDDGRGFELGQGFAGKNGGVGLLGMKERAELLGGHLEIRSFPGSGTRVWADIPAR